MIEPLEKAARAGATQQELLALARESGAGVFEIPTLVATACRIRDLRELITHLAVLDRTAPPGCPQMESATQSARSMALSLGNQTLPPDRAIDQALARYCGDLNELAAVGLLLSPRKAPSEFIELSALISVSLQLVGGAQAIPSAELVAGLNGRSTWADNRFTPRTLAATLAPIGVAPVRIRIPGHAPGCRGYVRSHLEAADRQLSNKCHGPEAL